jgi:serine/threonine protein kinase
MTLEPPLDDRLLARLPLPLAQLYRRAHNAKSAQERHHAAYYLWEAALKLLGSAAVVSFLRTGRTPDTHLAELLQNLARPSVGHWWAIVRALSFELADIDSGFSALKDRFLGRARDDLPRVAGLDAALLTVLEGRCGGRASVRLTELFDRLVRYRNQEIGHGAVGQRQSRHYEEMGQALLGGVPQLLDCLDVLAGRRLVFLADVRRLSSGDWLVEHYELIGEAARRLESLERTHEEAAALLPQQVYLSGDALLPLHPLVAYDFECNEFLFLNARRGKQRVEYLCYTSGRPVDRVESAVQNALLADLLDIPVDDTRREEWQARSHSEESASEGEQPEEARRRLGEFELLSELGRGGMGVVYRAWQPSLGRQVALKSLLKSGDAKAEKRFAREIASLGRVEHPHLVRIFTSGSEGDRWFYAMELVEGTTLATVCDRLSASSTSVGEVDLATWRQAVSTACEEARRSEKPLSDAEANSPVEMAPTLQHGTTKSGESTARTGRAYVYQVVELMRQTAEAAHTLHEKGIIHRDIKPGNIMVGPAGLSATLMDLGLAQVADETEGRLTRTRQFVGTLRYASPEQLGGASLDRRADVYSLGATLWELLTLRPLFGVTEQTPSPDMILRIQQAEVERVRKHNPQVPADLEAVVIKCLEKDRSRRYQTARELADDLDRWKHGDPVLAQPPSLRYLLGKQVRRHRVSLLAAAGVLLVILGVVVAAFVQISVALEHEKTAKRDAIANLTKAVEKEEEAVGQRNRAEQAEQLAAAEANRASEEAATAKQTLEFLVSIFEVSDPDKAQGRIITAREILDRGAEWASQLKNQPRTQAPLLGSIGNVYRNLGLYAKAEPLLRQSTEILKRELGDKHPDYATSLNDLARLYESMGDYAKAEPLYRQALKI